MDVRLPDGTIVTNVPEGISQAELMRRLGKAMPNPTTKAAEAAGASMRDGQVNWGVELEKQINAEMSTPERVFKSLGAGFADIPLALKQIFNKDRERAKQLSREAEDKRAVDKDLAKKTDLGVLPDRVVGMETPTLGGFAQGYGKTVPTMVLPAGGQLGTLGNLGMAMVAGGAAGALEPTVEGESRSRNVATGAASSAVLPLATAAVRPVYNAVTRSGGQRKAADEVAKTLAEQGDEAVVLRQTIDRLSRARQGDIPLSTAAQLRDAQLARLEQGSRARNGANWYDFDQNQAQAVSEALRRATSSADDLAARRSLRASNYATNRAQALANINDDAFNSGVMQLRARLDDEMMSPDASNPAVRNMLQAIRDEIDRVGGNFGPEHLATIRANLSGKYNPLDPNVFKSVPRDVPATTNVLRQVDDILNSATNNRWSNAVQGYARDSDAVRAAQAAGKVRGAFFDAETGRVRGVAADAAGDVPKITEAGLGRALDAARGSDKSLMLSAQANNRLQAILDALRAQNIVQGVKRSATAGGGSDTAANQYAAQAAGKAAEALGASGSMTASAASAALNKLGQLATANKDRALAEALQNPQQMINLLERKLRAGAPMTPSEHYLLSVLRAAPATAATAQ